MLTLTIALLPALVNLSFIAFKKVIAWQMEEKLEKEMLTSLTVSETELVWVTKGKEAKIQGHFFDVKSFSISDNNIMLTGLWDVAEDDIQEKINRELEGKDSSQALTTGHIFLCLYAGNMTQHHLYATSRTSSNYQSFCNSPYQDHLLEITAPPPKA